MKSGITVITPTGDRPEAFRLCVRSMERQIHQPDQWIIVNDGRDNKDLHNKFSHVMFLQGPGISQGQRQYKKRTKQKRERKHTLSLNLLEALPLIEYDTILIMEDDDWYHPEYIAWMASQFAAQHSKLLLGQGKAIYYHLPSQRWMRCNNNYHASLCQTGFKSDLIEKVKNICLKLRKNTNPFIDIKLWLETPKDKKSVLFDDKDYCVGIKGMPGRQGTCAGWTRFKSRAYNQDMGRTVLRGLIGDDVELYKRFGNE